MRCPEHGLAVGPNGTCVLCRRRQASGGEQVARASRGPADSSWIGPNALVLGLVTLASVITIGLRSLAGLGPFAPPGTLDRAAAARFPVLRGTSPTEGESGDVPADLAAAMREVPVTVYYTDWCPHCRHARSWLEARQIPYEGIDVEGNAAAARKLRQLNPRGGIPTIVIDGEVLAGFAAAEVERRLVAGARRRLAEQ
ncbi:MAG: glutaredoxin family protein [Polyangiaceae bacterium]|nr:glutaredoxin family protein [Polyangiaceae bacterium]